MCQDERFSQCAIRACMVIIGCQSWCRELASRTGIPVWPDLFRMFVTDDDSAGDVVCDAFHSNLFAECQLMDQCTCDLQPISGAFTCQAAPGCMKSANFCT